MKTKRCSYCKNEKPIEEFWKSKNTKDGLQYKCKECTTYLNKQYAINNPEKIIALSRKWRENNRQHFNEKARERRRKNPEKSREACLKYYYKNRDTLIEKNKEWKKNNKDKLNKSRSEYRKKQFERDPIAKMKHHISSYLRSTFKNKNLTKNKRALQILDCGTWDNFAKHIESQFDDKMTWDNYAIYWEYDHIIELVHAKTYDEVIELNHYTNYRPRKVSKNRSDGAKLGNALKRIKKKNK